MAGRFWPAGLAVEAAAPAVWALQRVPYWLAIWLAEGAVAGPCPRNPGGIFTCSLIGGAMTGWGETNTVALGGVAGGTCIGGNAGRSKLRGGGGLGAVAGKVTGFAVLGGAGGAGPCSGQAWEGACLQDPRGRLRGPGSGL